MPRRTTVVDVTYDDARTGERVRERRIQEIPDDQVAVVRQKEIESLGPLIAPRTYNDQEYYLTRRADEYGRDDGFRDLKRREDYYSNDYYAGDLRDNNYLAVGRPRRSRSHRGASSRRRDRSTSSADSSDTEYVRRRSRGHRRSRSAKPAEKDGSEDEGGLAWFSGKPRKDCNFLERHFDSSYDGLIAAVAGAAIGSMTARRFVHKEGDESHHKKLKTIGGALAGAAAFNVVENHYRVYTEERTERRREERRERSQNRGA